MCKLLIMMLKMALGIKHVLFDFKSGFEIADFFDLQLTLQCMIQVRKSTFLMDI